MAFRDPYSAARERRSMQLGYDPQTLELMSRMNVGQSVPQATGLDRGMDVASKAGGAMTTAGMLTANPALGFTGLGLQGAGMLYDIYNENWGQGAKDRKRQQKMEDEQFALMRAKMLMELGEQKKKAEWNRRFTNRLIGGSNA